MEEKIPLIMSDAQLKAPEELFRHMKKSKEKVEMTHDERTAARRAKKGARRKALEERFVKLQQFIFIATTWHAHGPRTCFATDCCEAAQSVGCRPTTRTKDARDTISLVHTARPHGSLRRVKDKTRHTHTR